MKNNLWPLLSGLLMLQACGGSDTATTVPPVAVQPTYTLTLVMDNLSGTVGFQWLGQTHTVTAGGTVTLTRQAQSYAEPTDWSFPVGYDCSHSSSAQSSVQYQVVIRCKAPELNSQLQINTSLPYAVQLEYMGRPYLVQQPGLIDIGKGDAQPPKILHSAGPQFCNLTVATAVWTLSCEEFGVINEAGKLVLQSHSGVKVPLGIAAAPGVSYQLMTQDGRYYLAHPDGIYQFDWQQDKVVGLTLSLPSAGPLTVEQLPDQPSQLVSIASAGLYRLQQGTWQLLQKPATTTFLPEIYRSGNRLSWLGRDPETNGLVLLQRLNGEMYRISKAPTIRHISSDSGALRSPQQVTAGSTSQDLVVWPTWQDEALELTVLMTTSHFPVARIPALESPAVWQISANHSVVIKVGQDHLEQFGYHSSSGFAFNAIIEKTTEKALVKAGEYLTASGALLLNGDSQTPDRVLIQQLYLPDNDGKAQSMLTKIQRHTGSTEPFFLASEVRRTDQIRAMAPKVTAAGYALLFQGSAELGTVWLTNGNPDQTFQVKSSVTWQQYQTMRILAVGRQLALVQTDTGQHQLKL